MGTCLDFYIPGINGPGGGGPIIFSKRLKSELEKYTNGEIYDVIVDLRKDSISFGKWLAFELSQDSNNSLIIPKGCAHGFQVLEKDSHLLYIHSENWESSSETGVVWNDEKLSIKWPLSAKNISTRDTSLPKLEFYEI